MINNIDVETRHDARREVRHLLGDDELGPSSYSRGQHMAILCLVLHHRDQRPVPGDALGGGRRTARSGGSRR
jgi:hypothetical protein